MNIKVYFIQISYIHFQPTFQHIDYLSNRTYVIFFKNKTLPFQRARKAYILNLGTLNLQLVWIFTLVLLFSMDLFFT